MIVAGIDPSLTSAGIAVLRDGRPVLLRSIGHPNRDAKDWWHRVQRIGTQARAITQLIETKIGHPDLVAIEAPLTFGIENSADSYDRYCVFIGVCSQLAAWRTPYAVIHNQTRAKWATGRGGSKKKAVLDAVRITWAPWESHIANDDIADALTLAEACARHVGDELHFPPRRRHIEALHSSITWPSIPCPKPDNTQAGAPR